MRILLIRPPALRFPGQVESSISLPLGCLYIAAVLEAAGHDVSLLDGLLYDEEHPIWKWGERMMFGAPWSKVEWEIRRRSPELVGISNQFTVQIDSAVEVAEIAKRISPNIVTVVGGNHASILPQTFFELTNSIDIVCMGEGEYKLLDVIGCLDGKKRFEDVRGIAFRKDGRIVLNEQAPYLTPQELDMLPFPAYHLVDIERYFNVQKKGFYGWSHYEYQGAHRTVSMIGSRGCPFNCTFCSIHLHMGKRFRPHSVDNVLEHIKLLTSRYGVRHIHFDDDNLTLDRARFNRLLDGLLAKQFGITWDTPNGVRADLLPKELIVKSKEASCTYFILGVESGDQANVDRIVKKKLNLQHVERVARTCKELGLDLLAFYIIGFPQETIEGMQATLDFALRLEREYDVFPIMNVLNPLVGTEAYCEALAKGYLVEGGLPVTMGASIAGNWLIETENFTRADIARLVKGFYRKNKYLLIKKLMRFILRHPQALVRLLSGLWRSSNRKHFLMTAMATTNCLIRDFRMKSKLSPVKHRIVYLSVTSTVHGAEMSLLALLRSLNRELFEPLVVLPGPGPMVERLAHLGVEIVIIPLNKLKASNPFAYLKTVFSIVKLIRNKGIDLIHSNRNICNQYGVAAARLTGIPIVCHTRNILTERPFRKMFLSHADVLIANSRAVAASYAGYVAKSQKVVVIHNGVDLDEFLPSRTKGGVFRSKLGLPYDAFIIGHIARICPEKGQHTLIDAMAQVAKSHPEAYALIAGDTVVNNSAAFLMSLKQCVLKYGLVGRVFFLGFVDNIIDLYADLDLVVLPSFCEGFGRTSIEAMAMEKPVIATSLGGLLEIVENGVTGFLISPNDPVKLAEAISNILQDKKFAKKLGENGREQVKRFFSLEKNIRETEQVYLELLNSKKPI